jgi:uncharacterized protein
MNHPIQQTIDLVGFLTLGLLGGFGHCIGMCAPFVLFVSRRYDPAGAGRGRALASQLWYAAGRVTTYAVLGGVAGALGAAVQRVGVFVGLQRAAMVLAGAVLVVWALVALWDLVPGARRPGRLTGARSEAFSGLFGRVTERLKRRVPGHPFALGLFLGLLPCGFLYSAVVAAVARGSALQGGLAMAVFGAATVPALLGVSLADEIIGARRRALLNAVAQVFILAMGARFLWRGLSALW